MTSGGDDVGAGGFDVCAWCGRPGTFVAPDPDWREGGVVAVCSEVCLRALAYVLNA